MGFLTWTWLAADRVGQKKKKKKLRAIKRGAVNYTMAVYTTLITVGVSFYEQKKPWRPCTRVSDHMPGTCTQLPN